jgi:hypothetical protein
MTGYTEVLQTMLAMVLVSFLVLNANRAIVTNNTTIIEGELEDQVIAIAQDFIDESRSTTFDAETVNGGVPIDIPGGFSAIGPGFGETDRTDFNDFDDYDGWTETITLTGSVEYQVSIEVDYYDNNTKSTTASKTTMKQMTIVVQSDELTENEVIKTYTFKFLRSFYAD